MQPGLFTKIIRQLTQNFTVVSLENYLQDPGTFKVKRKTATVMFDDGYRDNVEVAAPILKKFNCPASFYVVSGCIDNNIPTWTYIIDNTFLKTKKNRIEFDYAFVPEKFKSIQLKLSNRHNPLIGEIKPWLKKVTNTQRLLIFQSLLDQCADVPVPGDKMMNWNEVRQLDSEGFIIGSHTHTHPMLSSLEDEGEITGELKKSAQKIYQKVGKYPLTISYPINSFDERVIRLSKQEGYKYGLAVGQHFFRVGKDDMFRIPRAELHQEPWWKVQIRIKGIYSRMKKVWVQKD